MCSNTEVWSIIFYNVLHSSYSFSKSDDSDKKLKDYGPAEHSIVLQGIGPQTLFKEFPVSMSNGCPSMSVLLANPKNRLRNVDLIG